jgi:hypothetical protein
MNPLDLIVVVAIAAVLGLPYLRSAVGLLSQPKLVPLLPPEPDAIAWRQRWAANVIDLIDEIEDGQSELERPDTALRLARELVWEIIGGDGPQPSKSK